LKGQLYALEEIFKDLYIKLQVECHEVQCYLTTKAKLQGQIDFINSIAVPNAQQSAAHAIKLLEQSQSDNANLNKRLILFTGQICPTW
jgi:hypothetical protein